MFNKVIHLLQKMGKSEDNPQLVQESVKKIAENNFLTDITNGRRIVGDVNAREASILRGHQIIGDFIVRGIEVQKRKMKEENF